MGYLTVSGDMNKKSVRIRQSPSRVYLGSLLSFLDRVVHAEDVIRHPYEVCIDCKEVAELGKLGPGHNGHTIVSQDCDHSGVTEWIRCLKWMLENE